MVTLTPYPRTPIAVVANIIYVATHNLEEDEGFYSDASLQRLFNAGEFEGVSERTVQQVSLLFELRCAPHPVTINPALTLPGATEWVRKGIDKTASATIFSMYVTFNDPAVRPDYEAIERLLGDSWNDWDLKTPLPFTPPPHQLPDVPRGPPRNAVLILRKTVAQGRTTVDLYFDDASKLKYLNAVTSFDKGTH